MGDTHSDDRFVDRDMLLRYYWGMGIGHTYAHIKPPSTEEPCGGSMGIREAEFASLSAVNQCLRSQPGSQYMSMSHSCEDNPTSGSKLEDGWQDNEDAHSSSGELDAEVSSSSKEDRVLEMYFTSDVGSDQMDIDEYL